MRTFLLFIVTIASPSAVFGDEFFTRYVNNFVNNSVSPCDNFYRHVCSRNMQQTDRLTGHAEQVAQDWIIEGAKILEQTRNYTAFEAAADLAITDYDNMDMDVVMGKIAVKLYWRMLERMQYMNAVPDIHMFAPRRLMHEIIKMAKKEIEVSDSLYNDKTKSRMRYKLATLKTEKYDEYTSSTYETIFGNLEDFFQATGALASFNESNVKNKLQDFLGVFGKHSSGLLNLKPLVPTLQVRLENRTTEMRAWYQPGDDENFVVFFDPTLILSINAFIPAKYGSAGFIMGHEMFHSILSSKEWTNDVKLGQHSVCLASHMENVCKVFNEGVCVSGAITYNEDSADMESVQLLFKMMRDKLGATLKHTIEGTDVTNEQMFFYANAMFHCRQESEDGSINHLKINGSPGYDSHSYGIPRVNGPLSLMNAFHEAFSCKAGDRMFDVAVGREGCNAFGDPVRK